VRLGLFLWALVSPTEPVELSLTPEPPPPAEPLLAQMNEAMERVELDLEAYLATLDQENSAAQAILADLQTRSDSGRTAERFSLRAEWFPRKRCWKRPDRHQSGDERRNQHPGTDQEYAAGQ
jgi:hypothetical protein